jgi:hypothetical protein
VSRLRPILIISCAVLREHRAHLFLIDFVNYLATQRQMGWIKLASSRRSFHGGGGRRPRGWRGGRSIIKGGGSVTFARKLPVASGLIMASSLF